MKNRGKFFRRKKFAKIRKTRKKFLSFDAGIR